MRTVRDTVQPYLSQRLALGQIGAAAARKHRWVLLEWATVAGDRPLHRLSARDVERLAESWDGIAPSTRRVRYSILRSWHRWARQRDLVPVDLLATLVPPREPRRTPRSLSADQVAKLIAAAPDARDRALVVWAVQLGLRCCELARLDYADVDLDGKRVRIVGKGGHERLLPIPAEAEQALLDYWGDVGVRRGPLFRRLDTDGRLKPETVGRRMSLLFAATGVKRQAFDGLSAHALRHTMATDLLRSGKANIVQIKAALGHASITTTTQYLRAVEADDLVDVMAGRTYMAG